MPAYTITFIAACKTKSLNRLVYGILQCIIHKSPGALDLLQCVFFNPCVNLTCTIKTLQQIIEKTEWVHLMILFFYTKSIFSLSSRCVVFSQKIILHIHIFIQNMKWNNEFHQVLETGKYLLKCLSYTGKTYLHLIIRP